VDNGEEEEEEGPAGESQHPASAGSPPPVPSAGSAAAAPGLGGWAAHDAAQAGAAGPPSGLPPDTGMVAVIRRGRPWGARPAAAGRWLAGAVAWASSAWSPAVAPAAADARDDSAEVGAAQRVVLRLDSQPSVTGGSFAQSASLQTVLLSLIPSMVLGAAAYGDEGVCSS
jgi:hypothetical protein